MANRTIIIIAIILVCFSAEALADKPRDYAVPLKVTIDSSSAPRVILSWPADTNSIYWNVYKKGDKKKLFGNPFKKIDSLTLSFTDTAIKRGVVYEYSVENYAKKMSGWSYAAVGFDIPAIEKRGRVLVLVDSTMIDSLRAELERLHADLIGEGWRVKMLPVPRADSFSSEKVQRVKNIILKEFKDRDSITAIFLLGRVPVPYSGNDAPDGHEPDHFGAWPADVYYGDIHGEWPDIVNYAEVSVFSRQHNVASDGKFDKNYLDTDPSIGVGRVDFAHLTSFPQTEIELIRRYLNKDHAFRTGTIKYPKRAIIRDLFGMYTKEAFAADGWMNFDVLVGTDSTFEDDMQNLLPQKEFLWAYGCSSGGSNSAWNTAYSSEYASKPQKAVFMMLFGSWFGDWDCDDDLMRAAIASEPSILTCVWAARPFWHFHNLNNDATFGYCTLLSQKNQYEYQSTGLYGYRAVHVALMGDPTLTQEALEASPKPNLLAVNAGGRHGVELKWNDDGNLYHVFKANNPDDFYERISHLPVKDGQYFDENPTLGTNYYMVRRLSKIYTPTTSYFKLSAGSPDSVFYPALNQEKNITALIAPNPAPTNANLIIYSKNGGKLGIHTFNEIGEMVLSDEFWADQGYSVRNIITAGLAIGEYYVRIDDGVNEIVVPLSVVR